MNRNLHLTVETASGTLDTLRILTPEEAAAVPEGARPRMTIPHHGDVAYEAIFPSTGGTLSRLRPVPLFVPGIPLVIVGAVIQAMKGVAAFYLLTASGGRSPYRYELVSEHASIRVEGEHLHYNFDLSTPPDIVHLAQVRVTDAEGDTAETTFNLIPVNP